MTNAQHIQILRLPAQLASARAWLAQIERTPVAGRPGVHCRRRAAAQARIARYEARAALLGLRDLLQ